MFDKTVNFKGKHGAYIRELAKGVQSLEKDVTIFKTNIQVYLVAPIIGVLFNRRAMPDKSTPEDAKIMLDTISTYQDELNYVFKVVMLSLKDDTLSDEKRIDRAFRYNYLEKGNESNSNIEQDKIEAIKLFEEYTLGGIEVLHEKIYKDDATREHYLENMYEFIRDFYDDVYAEESEIVIK